MSATVQQRKFGDTEEEFQEYVTVKYSKGAHMAENQPRAPKGTDIGGQWIDDDTPAPRVKRTETDDYKLAGKIDVSSDEAEDFLLTAAEEINLETGDLSNEDDLGDIGNSVATLDDNVRGRVKDAIVRDLAKDLRDKFTAEEAENFLTDFQGFTKGEDPYQQVAQSVVDRWARTSGDSDSRAIGVQLRAREIFDLDAHNPAQWDATSYRLRDAQEFANKHQKVIDATLKSVYNGTQAHLANEGVEEVILYRGMAIPRDNFKHDPGALAFETIRMQPLSSFTSHLPTAASFAYDNSSEGEPGIIMAVRVPRKQIFSTAVTGPGCLVEGEFLIMGQKGGLRAAAALREPLAVGSSGRRNGAWFVKAVQEWREMQERIEAEASQ